MPGRLIPIITEELYHVFNLGIDHRPTFTDKREFFRAKNLTWFYSFSSPPLRFSDYWELGREQKDLFCLKLEEREKLVDVISYCLMPNHFHFLLKQRLDGGIAKYMSNFQNSFTRYFNMRNRRLGSLFLDQFKAVRVETDEQLLHLSRYIHLNPYTSFLVKSLDELEKYSWSSFPEYLGKEKGFCQKEIVWSFYRNPNEYKKFIFDQAEYQRRLGMIRHLVFEKNP